MKPRTCLRHGVEQSISDPTRGHAAVGMAEICTTPGIKATGFCAAYGGMRGLLALALALYGRSEGGFIAEAPTPSTGSRRF